MLINTSEVTGKKILVPSFLIFISPGKFPNHLINPGK